MPVKYPLIYIEQILTFAEFGSWNQNKEVVSDTIEFTEDIRLDPLRLSARHTIDFRQTHSVWYGNRHVTVNQTLVFNQVGATKDLNIGLYQNIFFIQDGREKPTIGQSLVFSEVVQHFKGQDLVDLLEFTESLTYKLLRILHLTDTLNFIQYLPYYKNNVHFINPVIPPIIPPVFTTPIPVVIQPPVGPPLTLPSIPYKKSYVTFIANFMTITISAPEIGDDYKMEDTKILRNTRNGDLIVYSDPMWPKSHILNYRFSFLTLREIESLKIFIKRAAGYTFEYVDYEDVHWLLLCTTPELEYEQTGRNNYTTNLELQGIRV